TAIMPKQALSRIACSQSLVSHHGASGVVSQRARSRSVCAMIPNQMRAELSIFAAQQLSIEHKFQDGFHREYSPVWHSWQKNRRPQPADPSESVEIWVGKRLPIWPARRLDRISTA